jgi:cytochrome c peroxidase
MNFNKQNKKGTIMILKLGLSALLISSAVYATADMQKWLRPAEVPQPKDNKLTPQRVALGKLLYFDTRLSANGKISCATCHNPKRGWTDLIPVAKAIGAGRGPRNSPTILNSAYQSRQFWDGRARTLEKQALGPIEADVEMNSPLKDLIPKLNKIKGYVAMFNEAYPGEGGLTKKTLAKAIASFERTVVSTTSPFDKYAKGNKNAISETSEKGFELFKDKAHCMDCHDKFNFTDGSFHNIGLHDGELQGKELGRYLTKRRAAWYGVFKTPTLRDVTKSGPYFHDGSVKTLKEAVTICASGGRYKNGVKNKSTYIVDRKLTDVEIDEIVSFLKTLSGPDIELNIPTKFPQ